MVGTETTIAGAGLQITASAGRDGIISVDSIVDGGSGYAVSNNNTVRLVETGGTLSINRLFNIDEIQDDFTDAKTTSSATGGTTTTDAERGDQFIASGPLDTSFTEVAGVEQVNVVGENRVRTVEVNADKKIAGAGNDTDRIHVGDSFSITVTEVKHDDELSGAWPESNTGTNTFGEQPNSRAAHSITASYTAIVGDDEDSVAAGLRQAYFTARTAYVATETLAEDDLPNAADTGNTITFTSGRKGEDFNVVWNQSPNPDVINATGAVNNPSGSSSHIPNVSPFSITKSIDYFTEMLSQNGAETSRLMKAQEHLENTIVNTEHAWGKITDTDYARASTEQVRNSLKMQMASNIISKSIRMNDLLVDLTTKHHRGAMLNARA
jgi:flagellin-like hook-associated protein FlgL